MPILLSGLVCSGRRGVSSTPAGRLVPALPVVPRPYFQAEMREELVRVDQRQPLLPGEEAVENRLRDPRGAGDGVDARAAFADHPPQHLGGRACRAFARGRASHKSYYTESYTTRQGRLRPGPGKSLDVPRTPRGVGGERGLTLREIGRVKRSSMREGGVLPPPT